MDFDDLDDAEEARDEEEAPLRIAQEEEAVKAEEALNFTSQICRSDACNDTFDQVQLRSKPDASAKCVGVRKIGDVLRFVRKSGDWALLHPLELTRVAADYQDYWHAILKDEVPRLHEEAWIPTACLEPFQTSAKNISHETELHHVDMSLLSRASGCAGNGEIVELIGRLLTIVVSTSPAEHHCNVELLLQVLESLHTNEALRHCRIIVVFDAMPPETAKDDGTVAESGQGWVPQGNQRLVEAYEHYKNTMEKIARRGDTLMNQVQLLLMPEWGHLVGTVRHALQHISTPFVFLHQHDLLLSKNFMPNHVVGILQALAQQKANYVILNRDVNFAGRATQYFQAAPHRPDLWRVFMRHQGLHLDDDKKTPLMPFIGYSDQSHLARTSWIRNHVLPLVGERKCCMEFAVHEIFVLAWLHDPSQWEKTYMLGGMDDGPFIYDTVKNGSCWAYAEDAYSPEKEDEMYVRPEDRVQHPDRPGLYLSLYVYQPGAQRLPGRIVHYPDPDAYRNKLSMEQFDLHSRSQNRVQRRDIPFPVSFLRP